MSYRKIAERDVLAVIANPTKIEAGYEGRMNYFGIAPNGRPIRVTLAGTTVVTVAKAKRSRVG
jgi:hypothetical protein